MREEIGGYDGLQKFMTPLAWSNFTRDYISREELGLNLTYEQQKYGKCGTYPPPTLTK